MGTTPSGPIARLSRRVAAATGRHAAAGATRPRSALRSRRLWTGPVVLALFAGAAAASIELAPEDAAIGRIDVTGAHQGRPGAELREALAASEAGDRSLADDRLEALAARYPVIADYADLFRLRLRVDSGATADAVALAAAWRHADSPLEADRLELLGAAHAALGNAEEARAAWARAAKITDDEALQAALRLKRAESFEADGDLDAAAASYLEIWTAHPLQQESERAAVALDAIAARRGADLRTGAHHRKRGDGFYRRHRNEAALAAYERALQLGSQSASETRRAQRQRTHTLFRLRRYTEAAKAFAKLPATDENQIDRARAIARAGDAARSARELEAIGRKTRGWQAARALFLAALLWEGEGETERARKLYDTVARPGSGTSYANAALWRLGWAAFREDRIDEAKVAFERLSERDGHPISSLRSRYWLARAQERAGDAQATQAFSDIAREFPFSYYGWRARLRIDSVWRTAPVPAIPDGVAALAADELARPRILLEAGLEAEAGRELDRLYPRADGLGDRLALSNLYADNGDFHRAQRLIVEAYSNDLARGPVPDQLDLWWHAWPAPFAEGMRRATSDGDLIEPGLIYALMREESGYRPSVVSTAGARGLMQIMPETGERLARDVALADFTADDLFVPDVNMRLGSHYLHQLLERFDGQKSAAIASYNAGPAAVSRWIDPSLEDDEWVESIPYEQTRTYVKRVLRSLHVYRVLY
jgi:soluble lytic murein transglycosylase